MVFADNNSGVRKIQCASNSSQANARVCTGHQIEAIVARELESCVFCFIEPMAGHSFFCIRGLEKRYQSDDSSWVNCSALQSRFGNAFRGQANWSSKLSVCSK